jgi:hypothetical protein
LAGFLDRGCPEVEKPLVAGELAISATYEVGELITGCCTVTEDVSYQTLSWYAMTIGDEFFDVREPVNSRLICEEVGGFCFSIPSAEFAPGYYDVWPGAPFIDCNLARGEVVAPAE